jgi:transposase-like protein
MRKRKPRPRAGHRTRFNRAPSRLSRYRPTRHIPPELIAEAKRLYLHSNVPVVDICALLGLVNDTFYRRIKQWGWPMRSERIPVQEPSEAALIDAASATPVDGREVSLRPPPTEAERLALASRLYRLVEAEMAASEAAAARLGSAPDPASEQATRSRALGALARALQSANALCHPQPSIDPDEPDDPPARTVEQLERAILKHLEDFERERAVELARKNAAG